MSFDFISGLHNNKNFIVIVKTCFRENRDNLNKEKIIYPGGKRFLTSYHFFSGIGLGTVFTLHGTFGAPFRFLPSTVPTSVNGRMTKITMLVTATCIV